MAIKAASQLTADEKKTLRRRKGNVQPLFETPDKEKQDEKPKRKRTINQKVAETEAAHSKPKRSRKKKTTESTKVTRNKSTKPVKKPKRTRKEAVQQTKEKSTVKRTLLKVKTLYDDEAYDKLVELYSSVTAKKTKKEKEDEKTKNRSATSLCIALHEDTKSERFNMMGKLVEKGYAKYKAYVTDYHIYKIFN